MSDSKTPRTLLAQLSWRFRPRMEELAVEALAYILNRYPASKEGLAELVEPVPDMRLSAQPCETEAVAPDGTRPDVLQRGDDGSERLFIEAKFYAPLTRNQPVRYLERLPQEGVSVLMFLAPDERVDELWPELLDRLDNSDLPYSDKGSRCVGIEGTGKHLLITDWTKLLDNMEERLRDSTFGLAELRQLRGLVQFAESGEGNASLPGKDLVNRVTEIGKTSGWLDTRGLRATPGSYGYGRYANLGRRYQLCVWLGVNLDLFEKFASTRLWVLCDNWNESDTRSWKERVRPALKERMKPHIHEEGEALWIGVVPERSTRADNYAAALERIAGILDELAEPWVSTPTCSRRLAEGTSSQERQRAPLKVITWNVNKAAESRPALWEMVQREDADIVLLQEVNGIPRRIRNRYQCHWTTPRYFEGSHAPSSTAVLSKGLIDATPYLESELGWVNRIHAERSGWIVACKTTLDSGERFRVVSVYSPAFPIPRDQWADVDTSEVKLRNNPELWFTEILWALLRSAGVSDDTNWIVGGDFNSSVLLDEPKDTGNREIIERLNALGLTDCLSHLHGGAVPTFQHPRKMVDHQLDYCYVNAPMLERLRRARVPSHEEVFDPRPRLSDHLPIVCEFD